MGEISWDGCLRRTDKRSAADRVTPALALGLIAYPILKLLAGKAREVHPLVYAAGLLFAFR